MAGFRRCQMGALGRLRIEAKAKKLSGEVVLGRAWAKGVEVVFLTPRMRIAA